jgi:MATE family multidrug resistance protein
VSTAQTWKAELRPMVSLATPIVVADVGWMLMGIVDTMMVGRLPDSAGAIGAVSLGSILFYTIGIFGSGLLLGMDTLVSQSFGARDLRDCHRSLRNGLYLTVPLAPALMAILWGLGPLVRLLGDDPAVLRLLGPYLNTLTWSTFPLLVYFAARRYLQSVNVVQPVMVALVTANLVNLAGNWALVYGHWGAPALGVAGSAWATVISRVYMAALLLGVIVWREGAGWLRDEARPDFARMRRLLALGFPAGTQILLEIGVLAVAAALIGRLDAVSLAGHQITLNSIAFTFMVTAGVGSSAAVRVGQALGRKDRAAAARSGWTALALGTAFMTCATALFLIAPRPLARIYTSDENVIRTAIVLLGVGAFFQIFDGLQVVVTGALRGLGDTRTPMICHLLGYWAVGLPLGYMLCFRAGWGAFGMWIGLCAGVILIGSVLLGLWALRVRGWLLAAEVSGLGAD